jgi:serine/threonine protein kinase
MMTSEVPHNIHSRFEIGKVLGQGGYATVREATSKLDTSHVALKIMNREGLDANTEKNIRNEVSLLQSLNHPNIVRGFDFFEEPKQFYFVMEKIDGGELFDRIVKKTHYTEKEARSLVRTLLSGIKYCHDRSIAHRFVCVHNVFTNVLTHTVVKFQRPQTGKPADGE